MVSKVFNSVVELNKINYDTTNNRIDFSTAVYSNGSPIADETAGSYANSAFVKANSSFAHANAAFNSANNVTPQIQPAFNQANAAFEAANSGLVRQSFLANTGQTNFITNGYTIGYVDVFVNGIKLYDAEDFVATDGANVSITQPPLSSNDVVEIISHGNNPSVVARVDQFARDYVNNAWSAANSAYNFANSVYSIANNAANSAASAANSVALAIPITGSANISGNLVPITDNTYYLGSSTNRWHSLFVGPGSIDIGGLKLSNVGGTLSISSPGQPATPIAGEDTWVRAQANAAFQAANSAAAYGANTTSTGFLAIPNGTTAQRPAAAANGHMRYNTTNGSIEVYLHSAGWTTLILDQYTVEYLVVGGGGGAGTSNGAAGGGAGGLLNGTFTAIPRTSYSITVGGGGASTTSTSSRGSNGTTSIIGTVVTALGGGGSGSEQDGYRQGNSGGSGGGGVRTGAGGAGTPGQGYPGGSNVNDGPPHYRGGGGGGAGGAGQDGSSSGGGNGGIGRDFSAWASATNTGDSGYYAGGGAGGSYNVTAGGQAGTRGLGGGGPGGSNLSAAQLAGYPNTGGGGGGHGAVNVISGAGGSGIIILRYYGPQRGSGGTVSSAGGYTYHTFTGSGSFTA